MEFGNTIRWSVFETTEKKTSYRWYVWVFICRESIVHIIDPSRSARVIEEHLGTVQEGILLVDRYGAYKLFAKKRKGVRPAFCWSHVRRDFLEVMRKYSQLERWGKSWQEGIDGLFHANRLRLNYVVGSDSFERENAQTQALLSEMEKRWEEELTREGLHHAQQSVLKSLKAHWKGLCVFAECPHIPMDNNGSERVLRNAAVGRKNHYGSGTVWSGRLTAILLSVFETCELWGINQRQWLMEYLDECAKGGAHRRGR
jgi:transposase